MTSSNYITHNFTTGKVEDATFIEQLGLFSMKCAAWMTAPIDFVGFSKAAILVKACLFSDRPVRTQLFDDTLFQYQYADQYWARMIYNGEVYSPGEENFLKAIKYLNYAFIDCGANFGYMSAVVSSKAYGEKPCIAIEADPNTFQILKTNAELNNNRFEIRHNAVFSKSGELVNMFGDKHEARSMVNEDGASADGNVETLALNDLAPWVKKQKCDKLILKLDVEGVEIEAVKGSLNFMNDGLLIMYEDHASDKTHEVSNYLMNVHGMRLFYSDGGECRELFTMDDVSAIKKNSRRGYDLIATKDESWLKEIETLKL